MKKYELGPPQDWNYYFREIFSHEKINNFLEFGLGVGTEFLLENCEKVTSVELSLGSYNLEWYEKTKEKLKDYDNWESHYVNVPEEISNADQRAQKLRFPLEDTKYLKVLKKITDPFISNSAYDFIFVDAGIHLRGDLVNLSFDKADIIAAHDTSRDHNRVLKNIYGYNIVQVPSNYVEIHFEDTYMGTTIWIKKDKEPLIDVLRNYKVNR
jgi:hypothetical protein